MSDQDTHSNPLFEEKALRDKASENKAPENNASKNKAPEKKVHWHRLIALAGLVQATQLVEQLAKTGYLNNAHFETAVNSLFEQAPDSPEAVFGCSEHDLSPLHDGFQTTEKLLHQHRDTQYKHLLRYILGILHLQKKLQKRNDLLNIIGTRLERAKQQALHFDVIHDNVIANIAEVYIDTISTFPYRIQVSGEYAYLQQKRVANQIRTLLLAGVRAATLWRQLGGSRWQLLFQRNKYASVAKTLTETSQRHISSQKHFNSQKQPSTREPN